MRASQSPCPGNAMASFYLGAVSDASVDYYNVLAEYPRQYAYAAHAGDSWRITPKLTLNYSMRWDYIAPFKEKFNNLSFIDPVGINPGLVNPISGGPQAAGWRSPETKWCDASYGKEFPESPFKNGLGSTRRLCLYSQRQDRCSRRIRHLFRPGVLSRLEWRHEPGGLQQAPQPRRGHRPESFNVPAIYLNSGHQPEPVGPTKNIASDFDNGTNPAMYRPLDGNTGPTRRSGTSPSSASCRTTSLPRYRTWAPREPTFPRP